MSPAIFSSNRLSRSLVVGTTRNFTTPGRDFFPHAEKLTSTPYSPGALAISQSPTKSRRGRSIRSPGSRDISPKVPKYMA